MWFWVQKTNDIFSKSQGERGQASNSHDIELLQRGVVAQPVAPALGRTK